MNKDILAVQIERAAEQLRQEREIFEQRKQHESRWFCLRLVMGYLSVVLLIAVMLIASYILFNNPSFPPSVVAAAGAALFADVLGMLVGVWKIALNPNFMTQVTPVTSITLPELDVATQSLPTNPRTQKSDS
jgi:hypothetical protein